MARGVPYYRVTEPSQILELAHSNTPDTMFVAADQLPYAVSGDMMKAFTKVAPKSPVVLLSEMPTSKLIKFAIRERLWAEVPKSSGYSDLVQRYTSARAASPALIVDDDMALHSSLNAVFKPTSSTSDPLPVASSVGDALEMVIDGRAPVFLKLARHLPLDIDTSILVYDLCPTTIAILVQMTATSRSKQAYHISQPPSRFAVLDTSACSESDIEVLIRKMGVSWPSVLPKPVPKPSAKPTASLH